MIFETTSAEVIDRALNTRLDYALLRQLCYGCISLFCALLIWFYGFDCFLKYVPYLFYFLSFCLLLVLIPGIGQKMNGARRWMSLGFFSFQPSEFLKVVMPLYFIYIWDHNPHISWKKFYQMMAIFTLPLALVLVEPDHGTVVMMICTMSLLFFISGVPWRYWFLPIFLLAAMGVAVGWNIPYVRERVKVYLHPERDLMGKGYQPHQAKIAVGSGYLRGRGAGGSLQKFYLPEARNDYIAAIYAEEFGFIGILFLLMVYLILTYSGFHIAWLAPKRKYQCAAAILTSVISLQAFMNLGIISGLLPSKGFGLPFFSQGGSSLLVCSTAVVLVMNIGKTGTHVVSVAEGEE